MQNNTTPREGIRTQAATPESGSRLSKDDRSKYKLWKCWLMVFAFIGLITLLTLGIFPPLWNYEAQIIEHGRLLPFHSDHTWSMNWWSAANRPILLWSYLGPALQETAFRVTRPLSTGPRLASLVGAMAAATVLLGWLLAMKTDRRVTFMLGLIFLVDPMFVQNYRGARIDCWALAFCI